MSGSDDKKGVHSDTQRAVAGADVFKDSPLAEQMANVIRNHGDVDDQTMAAVLATAQGASKEQKLAAFKALVTAGDINVVADDVITDV